MTTGKTKKQKKINAQNSVRVKKKPRGKPFTPGNPYKFKSKEENGGKVDPRIAIGGRPKAVGEAYAKRLAQFVPNDPQGRTYAELGAETMIERWIDGDVNAGREIRTATEGEKHIFDDAWIRETAELVKAGMISHDELTERGIEQDDIRRIFIAAGAFVPAGASEKENTDA